MALLLVASRPGRTTALRGGAPARGRATRHVFGLCQAVLANVSRRNSQLTPFACLAIFPLPPLFQYQSLSIRRGRRMLGPRRWLQSQVPLFTSAMLAVFAALPTARIIAADEAVPAAGTRAVAEGILVLRSGVVVSGKIVRSGDQYEVQSPAGTMAVPESLVKLRAPNLGEAYARLRASAEAQSGANGRITLAQWCLTNHLEKRPARSCAMHWRSSPIGTTRSDFCVMPRKRWRPAENQPRPRPRPIPCVRRGRPRGRPKTPALWEVSRANRPSSLRAASSRFWSITARPRAATAGIRRPVSACRR